MRPTSLIAGVLALLAALGVLGWAISPDGAKQSSGNSTADVNNSSDPPPTVRDKTGEFEDNPFTFSQEGPHPLAVVEEEVYEFGQQAVRQVNTHDFVIRNDGQAPLELAKGHTTCKCTGFELGMKEIAPGESAKIHLEWRPMDEAETFSQSATIWSNDPKHAEINLMVRGEVVSPVKVFPGDEWIVGSITEGSEVKFRGYVASEVETSFEITSIEIPSQYVKIEKEPMDAAALEEQRVAAGYWLDCTVDPAIPVGVLDERITVNTTLKEDPTLRFSLRGQRIGPFQIIGPGWRQDKQTLAMGRCKAAEGKKVQVSLFVSHLPETTIEFGEPQVTPPVINVTITRDESFKATGSRDRFSIVFEAPPGCPTGRWAKETGIRVLLPCNHPDASGANISVEFQAD